MAENVAERGRGAWVFDGVRVEPGSRRLLLRGRERACSQRAFDLLLHLAERPRVVHSRDRLLDLLWPGGQVVADEALTQAVFRLRAALAEYGERVVTVRGQGVRLDADVARIDEDAGASVPPTLAPAGSPPASRPPVQVDGPAPGTPAAGKKQAPATPTRSRTRPVALVAAAALAATLWAWVALGPTAGMPAHGALDGGYGLLASDVQAARPETVAMVDDALRLDGAGRRDEATALLEVAHANDDRSPLPALFLALWAIGGGDADVADRWLLQARERVDALAEPYLDVLMRYVEAERGGDDAESLRYAAAALSLRPDAWQMRLARAHFLNSGGLREAALAELQRIHITGLRHRKLAVALADRASLGDGDGAEAVFRQLPASDDSEYHFLAGRLAWSRGKEATAREAFLKAAERARGEGRLATVHRAMTYAGALAMILGDHAAAIDHLERARAGVSGTRQWLHEADISLILAQLRAEAGDAAGVRVELERAREAAARSTSSDFLALTALIATRMEAGTPAALPASSSPVVAHLTRARSALGRSDARAAASALQAAVHAGALETMWAEETALMLVESGARAPMLPPIDPPYPPLARLATRRAIAARVAAQSPAAAAGADLVGSIPALSR